MSIEAHYSRIGVLKRIEDAIKSAGKSPETIDVDILASVDEFHIGGQEATKALVNQLSFSEGKHVLDIGCGLGGTARFVASAYGVRVTGIDLTAEFVSAGNELCRWVGLEEQVTLLKGDALALPFEKERFDGATMIHVGMNIEDKEALFNQIHRVLRPGAHFGVYDIMLIDTDELAYPLPWASNSDMSHLASSESYTSTLKSSGFVIRSARNLGAYAIDFYERQKAKASNSDATPALGLHILMGQSTRLKLGNMLDGIQNGAIAPVEIIAQKV